MCILSVCIVCIYVHDCVGPWEAGGCLIWWPRLARCAVVLLFEPVPSEPAHLLVLPLKYMWHTYLHTYMRYCCYKIPSLSQMLTTDPRGSEECYACKLLEVLIIHCHHSLMQVGGAGPLVDGAGSLLGGQGHWWVRQGHWCGGAVTTTVWYSRNTNGRNDVTVDGLGHGAG